MARVFRGRTKNWGNLDYVTLWFAKARDYALATGAPFAFVTTNSIVQGGQVPELWPHLLDQLEIYFAHRSFEWSNLAANNAGITCVIIGMRLKPEVEATPTQIMQSVAGLQPPAKATKRLFDGDTVRHVEIIGPYLAPGTTVIVAKASKPLAPDLEPMVFGNKPTDGGNLILDREERDALLNSYPEAARFVRRLYGSNELTNDTERWCLWVGDDEADAARTIPELARRFEAVTRDRSDEKTSAISKSFADRPHRFLQRPGVGREHTIMVPAISTKNRVWLPIGVMANGEVANNKVYAIFDGAIWQAAVLSSRLHRLWLETVGGRMRDHPSYLNTLVWNTFPLPSLSERRKAELEEHWWAIDEARKEAGFGQSLGDLYVPATMPRPLFRAHEELDHTMETIFGSRRYRSDADRIEHMLQLYARRVVGEAMPLRIKEEVST